MPLGVLQQIVFDCPNPEALARFWQALIGGEVEVESADWAILDGDDVGFYLGFQRVPEQKTAKNRVHVDVEVDDLESAIDQAELLGARKIGGIVRDDDDDDGFQVMADPGGNEFCFVTG
ncbi:MAG TPA: VOC family protein [Ilumatobacter sp.]|nr:VOC family protein [Ilumatobacter sp.]